MTELQARIEAANKELAEFEAQAKQEVENPTPVVSPQIEEGPAHPVGPMYGRARSNSSASDRSNTSYRNC